MLSRKITILSLIAFNFMAVSSVGQVLKVDLKKDLAGNVIDLYQIKGAKPKGLGPLATLKDFELNLKWQECTNHAPEVYTTNISLRGWVGKTWLSCLTQHHRKTPSLVLVTKALDTIEKSPALFASGPWAKDLQKLWLDLKMDQLESQVAKKDQRVATAIDKILSQNNSLSRDQKSKLYQMLGDLALARVNYPEARFFYEEAQSAKDSTYLQEKIDFLKKTAGEAAAAKPSPTQQEVGGDELRLEARARQSLASGEVIAALKDIMAILAKYPGSATAAKLKDAPLEIYYGNSEPALRAKVLSEMESAEAGRVLEWAQNLHRRTEHASAYQLARKAVDKLEGATQLTSALWIAGRSAHFTGQYEKALEYYSRLAIQAAGTDEAAEGLFRASLIHYRKKEYSSAAALLEKLLLMNRDRYELNGQYWLVRSLQETNLERSKVEAEKLIEKFPFSYYGLRLRAEEKGGLYAWPKFAEKVGPLKTEFYLIGDQKASWKRYKSLSSAGWIVEAQAELTYLPFMQEPSLKVFLAEKFSNRGQFITAIRLINEAMDTDPAFRREEFIKYGYPTAFAKLYEQEGTRYNVAPSILRSLTRQESAFNVQAVSSSNALGLMQMIPPTAQEVAKKLGLQVELPGDMFRPFVNIPMGSFYIAQMLDQFDRHLPFALAAYNAGPTRMRQWVDMRPEVQESMARKTGDVRDEIWFDELPWSETSFYVKAILRNMLIYRLIEEKSFTVSTSAWQDLLEKKAK